MGLFDDADDYAPSSIAEGTYLCEVTNSTIDVTRTPGRVSFEYTVADGDMQGSKIWSNYQLEGKGLYFLKQDLKLFNIDAKTLGDIDALGMALEGTLQKKCNVSVKLTPKKDNPAEFWVNGYITDVYLDGNVPTPPPGLDVNDDIGF